MRTWCLQCFECSRSVWNVSETAWRDLYTNDEETRIKGGGVGGQFETKDHQAGRDLEFHQWWLHHSQGNRWETIARPFARDVVACSERAWRLWVYKPIRNCNQASILLYRRESEYPDTWYSDQKPQFQNAATVQLLEYDRGSPFERDPVFSMFGEKFLG